MERANTSLYLNWTAVNLGGYIARFIVTYKPLYTTECQTDTEEVDLSSDPIPPGVNHTVQKVIHGLDPNVSYSVTIIAYNSAGKPGENDTQKLVPRKLLHEVCEQCAVIGINVSLSWQHGSLQAMAAAAAHRSLLSSSDSAVLEAAWSGV